VVKQTNWRAVLIAYVVGVVAAIQVGRVAPATDALRADIGLDLATLGWAVSLITLASAFLGLAAGYLVVQRGARQILVFGLITLAAGAGLAAFSNSVTMLLLVRSLEGVGYLGIVVAAPTLIARVATPKDAPIALALWGTFFTLGLSIAAIAGGWLSETLGWRGWYFVNVVLLVSVVPLAYRSLPKDRKSDIIRARAAINMQLPAACWLLGAAFFGVTLLSLALLSMLPSFLIEARRMSPAAAGGMTGIVALASIGGSFAYGALANRSGQRRVIFAAVALLVVAAVPAFRVGLSLQLGISFAAFWGWCSCGPCLRFGSPTGE